MLFNSWEFIFLFMPIAFAGYFALNKMNQRTLAIWFLVLASLFFYSYWNIRYLPLILLSIIVNYTFGFLLITNQINICRRLTKYKLLVSGVVFNILLLSYYKYVDFFLDNVNLVFKTHYPMLDIILPLGISFFTFTQIAYLVDCYYGKVKETKLSNYFLFVTFFPHLLAGPILHHTDMMPQFSDTKNKKVNINNVSIGLFLFIIGLFKKIVLADTFAIWANNGFNHPIGLSFLEAWSTSLSYSFQLYFDFSGYTDMAIATAIMFNIRLPINFNSPYKATNIQDFWRRWHITLSMFLRDYLYIPLGGNRCGDFRTYFNLFLTFLLGGLWHGAGWTFVFWGALHGLALAIHRLWSKLGFKLNKVIGWFITFNFVNVAWVFFRAHSWGDAVHIVTGMCGFNGIALQTQLSNLLPSFIRSHISSSGTLKYLGDGTVLGTVEMALIMFVSFYMVLFTKNSNNMSIRKMAIINIFIFYFVIQSLFFGQNNSEFLYFRF
ncbi:MAG: MBOAT family protein [Burkholderiales bacterium]|nr:MBOAT family protein [Burkholderiales bacterium]